MQIEKLQPGMVVYDVGRRRMGNTTINSVAVWQITIVSVDASMGTVRARWNYNPEKTYSRRDWSTWRAKAPLLIRGPFGSLRLATRAEIAAAKQTAA
jgi:hypothetical protein